MRDSTQSLLEKLKQSDTGAFQKLFCEYQPILFKAIYYKTKDYNLAQDIVQDAFLKVWINRKSLKPRLSFFSYISTISNNLLKDHFRREQVRHKFKDSIPAVFEGVNNNPEDKLNHDLLEKEINRIVNEYLPEKCRMIFTLSRIEGMSNTEIANLLKISKKTVENQLYHALKVLRKKLSQYL